MTAPLELVLITGASGFVGNHTLHNFLANGYRVRVATRNQSSYERLIKVHATFASQLEPTIVPDITVSGAFNNAVKDVDGIVHMASPFVIEVEDNERDLILPALNGTKGIFESAEKYGTKVKRIVITSSFAAIADFSKGLWPDHTYDESQWNPMTYETTKDDKRGLAYSGSKKLAEEFAWAFMSTHPSLPFTLATVNPVMVFGPLFPKSGDLKHLGQSLGSMYELMTSSSSAPIPPTTLPYFVDVRDVAEAHRLAFESKTESPGRFLLSSGDYSNQAVCDLWRNTLMLNGHRIPVGEPGQGVGECYEVDASRAREVLGLRFRGFEECFGDMGRALVELERESVA